MRFLSAAFAVYLLFASVTVVAQESRKQAAPDGASTQVVDPILTRPVTELSSAEIAAMQKKLADWPQLVRYREENAALPPFVAGRVVFMGDSITDAWAHRENNFFPGRPYVDRGISGQTTPQMLLRFQQDVVELKPAVVVILGGINDIAGNTGYSSVPMIEANLKSMVEVAQANGIHVVLSSVLPAISFPWRPAIDPVPLIRELNAWMSGYAKTHGCVYLDYYTALADKDGGMRPGLSKDHVHPTPAGYAIMAPLAEEAIANAKRSSKEGSTSSTRTSGRASIGAVDQR